MDNFALTGLNTWTRALTRDEINHIFLCDSGSWIDEFKGWDEITTDAGFKLNTLDDEEDPCEENREKIYIFNSPLSMDHNREAIRFCSGHGGSMTAMENKNDLQELKKF